MAEDTKADWITQIRRGLLELLVLAFIDRGPTYGYRIVTSLSAVPQLAAGEGTVYPLLRRLRREGWLQTNWEASDAGPPRQYYRLSPTGKLHLDTLRLEWREISAAIDSALAREIRSNE